MSSTSLTKKKKKKKEAGKKGVADDKEEGRGGGGWLSFFPPWAQFLVYVFLVIALQGAYTYVQELLFQVKKFPYRWYATLWQGILYSLFSYLARRSAGQTGRRGPWQSYLFLSSMVFLGRFMGVECLRYIDFTTKILFQSSKMIPALAVGVLYLRKTYTSAEYVAVLLLVVGLFLFSIADASVTPTFNILGILLSSGDALSDAFKSNIQEHIMTAYSATTLEVALYTNLFACFCVLPILVLNGELVAVYNDFDIQAHLSLAVLYFVGYLASLCVLNVLRLSDALVSATVTCTRKFLSILFSFVIFAKVVTTNHVIGCGLFFTGLGLQIYLKHTQKKTKSPKEKTTKIE